MVLVTEIKLDHSGVWGRDTNDLLNDASNYTNYLYLILFNEASASNKSRKDKAPWSDKMDLWWG